MGQLYAGHSVARAPDDGQREQEARRWGIPLIARNGSWQLEHPEQAWDLPALASALQLGEEEIGIWPFCDSSNTRLLEERHLRLGLAEAQWSGHGQRGRQWHSSFGKHLYGSLPVEISAAHAQVLPVVAGLGVYQVLREQISALWLKWPNDLWIGQRKVAGLLLEGRHGTDGQRWVLGLGINVLADPALPATAISLREAGCSMAREELLLAIIQQWRADFAQLERSGFAAFRQRWREADRLCGQQVEFALAGERKSCRVLDIQDDGRLRIDDGIQQRVVHAGEVRLHP